jgi:hypothetical protein
MSCGVGSIIGLLWVRFILGIYTVPLDSPPEHQACTREWCVPDNYHPRSDTDFSHQARLYSDEVEQQM